MNEPTQEDLDEFAEWRQRMWEEEYQLWQEAFERDNGVM